MAKTVLRLDVNNLRVINDKLVGDLSYIPLWLYLDNYYFRDGDTIVDDGSGVYIEMAEDRFFDLAYEA